jgi:hypothetical protein
VIKKSKIAENGWHAPDWRILQDFQTDTRTIDLKGAAGRTFYPFPQVIHIGLGYCSLATWTSISPGLRGWPDSLQCELPL